MDSKELPSVVDEATDSPSSSSVLGDTLEDRKDMQRMGKRQELMRNFQRISAFSFTVILTATWEYLLMLVVSD